MIYRIASSLLLILVFSTSVHAEGDRIALCIGIDKYKDHVSENLAFAEKDVTEFSTVLRDVGYQVILMTSATGQINPDLVPTKKNIDSQIEMLIAKRKREDLLVLAFVGHSARFDKDPDCYFCPIDAKPSKENKGLLMSLDSIYGRFESCGAGTKLLLADWSHADQVLDPVPNDVLVRVPPPGVFSLFACSPNERGYEEKKVGHGLFFHHIVQGLKTTTNGSDEVELRGLSKEVIRDVPKTVIELVGKEKRQTPSLKASNVDTPVVLLTRSDCEILADFRAKEVWGQKNGSTDGYYKENGPKRIAVWKAAAERGSTKGMILYAKCLVNAAGVAKDEAEATKWYRRAAELGDTDAMVYLGGNYYDGHGVGKDQAEALNWYRKAAILGDTFAMCNLASGYLEGEGGGKDPVEAVKWYRKAAELGDKNAIYALGVCYYWGNGVEKDLAEAIRWFRKAADKGESDATFNLGMFYQNGQGVVKDQAEAVKWFRRAGELGNAAAMNELGRCYAVGKGVPKDAVEAFKWYQKGADLGHGIAMDNLGICYFHGNGIQKNAAEAVKWFHKAADAGIVDGMSNLAYCYEMGQGVKADVAEATNWYRKAAEHGNPHAMFEMGIRYQGLVMEKDDSQSIKWFRKAADYGHPDAMTLLGSYYRQGRGVKRDEVEAWKWYRMGAALGDVEAMLTLSDHYKPNRRGMGGDQAESEKWLKKAKESGLVVRNDGSRMFTKTLAVIKFPIDAETNHAYLQLGAEIVVVEYEPKKIIYGYRFEKLQDGKLPRIPEVKIPFGLQLNGAELTDEGLKELKQQKNLTFLNLKDNDVTDAGLKELKDFKNLEYLELTNTKVTDKGLKEFTVLKNLTWLFLVDTRVTAAGVKELQEALPKCKIILKSE